MSYNEQEWSTVPAPTQAPVVFETGFSHNSDYTWFYPYKNPTPGGVIKVYNALVDSDGKIGAWSSPTTLTVKRGWRLWGGAWNLPVVEDYSGVAWKLEIVSINPADDFPYNPYTSGKSFYLYTNWGGSYLQNDVLPVSGQHPYLQQLTEDAWRYYSLDKFATSSRHTTVYGPPIVVPASIPCEVYQLAYCRVTETGETALSPPYTFDLDATPVGTVPAESSWLRCFLYEYHPQGTLGLHFYRRKKTGESTWGPWERLPDAECYGTPSTPDDWLWPIWKRNVLLIRYVEGAPTHSAAVNPQSRLSKIHRLLRADPVKDQDLLFDYFRGPDEIVPVTTAGDNITSFKLRRTYDADHINVDADGMPVSMKKQFVGDVVLEVSEQFDVYCPVIDEWGNSDSGTTGGVGQQKFFRAIRSANFGSWSINQKTSQSGHKSWPTLLIHNSYSRWQGVKVLADGGDALAYSDYSGGQAFGNQFKECRFEAPMGDGDRVTCGVRISGESAPSHHPSEQLFTDCYTNGCIGLMLSGIQSANVRFDRLHNGSYAKDARGSSFHIENPNPLKFLNGCFADSYINNARGVIFRVVSFGATLQINDIWVDQGFVHFLESNNAPTQLTLTGGKINIRGVRPVFGLLLGAQAYKSTWAISDLQTQFDPSTEAPRLISCGYRVAEPLLERTGLSSLIIKEPSQPTALFMMLRFFNYAQLQAKEETGYKRTTLVPTSLTRQRSVPEINAAYLALSQARQFPAWARTASGQAFVKEVLLKNVSESSAVVTVSDYTNSLTTGLKLTREDFQL